MPIKKLNLSRKIAQLQHKENEAPAVTTSDRTAEAPPLAQIIHKSNQQRSLLTKACKPRSQSPQQEADEADASGAIASTHQANVAKTPKTTQHHPAGMLHAAVANKCGQTSPTSAETHEPSSIAAIAINGASVVQDEIDTASTSALITTQKLRISKNLQSDEMMAANHVNVVNNNSDGASGSNKNSGISAASTATFHPRIKYTNKSAGEAVYVKVTGGTGEPILSAIPTSVVVGVSTTPLSSNLQQEEEEPVDVKPLINSATGLVVSQNSAATTAPTVSSVIKPGPNVLSSSPGVPQAAAIAAALLRDGYHNFQQQLRAQEILKHHTSRGGKCAMSGAQISSSSSTNAVTNDDPTDGMPTKILENFLRQHHQQEQQHDDADDEEDESRYNGFEDIHLVEGNSTKPNFGNNSLPNIFSTATNSTGISSPGGAATAAGNDYLSDESQKFMIAAQASVLRNLEYTLNDFSAVGTVGHGGTSPNDSLIGVDGEPMYECRHCGKKYRWKSTLRRHENVECGGKEPSHQCPYCPYKSKQRGNLGVHVRKHHSNLPQLASKRRSKYSAKFSDGGMNSANASDDSSSSKLIIDCSK